MSGHWISTLAPPLASAPRAAVLAGQAAAGVLIALRAATRCVSRVVRREAAAGLRDPQKGDSVWRRAGRAVWRGLEAMKQSLRRPSKGTQPVPTLTRAQAAAREAAEVRNLAHSYSKSDPGLAADLYAAAERHERLYSSD
jgi:hypothetical protein